jgi:hypothetical protein
MISKRTWATAVARLELHFSPLANQDETIEIDGIRVSKYDALLEEFFNRIANLDELLFLKAIDYVIETHVYRSFPRVAEILEAVELVRSIMPRQEDHSYMACIHCRNQGIIIDKQDGLAKPCICERGQAVRRGWTVNDTKYRYSKAAGRRSIYEQQPKQRDNVPESGEGVL